ncbi:MAG: c-type cytochrome [Pirellulaceae bacterium]|jgi:putative membrane-bound dehydrogenase-like protein|nr:c-type cytochrome [Pirellulaceae bacterium]
MRARCFLIVLGCLVAGMQLTARVRKAEAEDKGLPTAEQLPRVPIGFEISVYAAEPLLYKPTSLCFDSQGRAMVGQGPQYHLSESVKEADSVYLLLDTDGNGVADRRKVFATGFNSIQGLAWKGGDLYVANSPELTVVRDLDGDDVADEYVVVYTDLGNHEHALHGLVWGPDGRLYMSKGNSKGHNQPEKFGRVAPKAFRELWDVAHPKGASDIPPTRTFTAQNYRKTYHDPHDDWGRQGGVLRCDVLGANLEIVSRGMRNPWDIAIDSGFNLLGTDNDQTQGDRIIMPFYGAHFGWGHRYSSHWTGAGNLPTVPVSGPMTSGSWAGIAYHDDERFPAAYRNVFFINDWMFGTYVYRPSWNGALRTSADGSLEPFIQRREGGMIYRPTDLAYGPDGAIYTLGWGGNYHYEKGREGSWLFRVAARGMASGRHSAVSPKAIEKQSVTELLGELAAGVLPARRVNAQDELVRRGAAVAQQLTEAIASGRLTQSQQTWAVWALGRVEPPHDTSTRAIQMWAEPPVPERVAADGTVKGRDPMRRISRNLRIQSIRILAFRARQFDEREALLSCVKKSLADPDPRVRFAAVQAIHQTRLKAATADVVAQLGDERDRVVFYTGWQALRDLATVRTRRSWLNHQNPRVRLAALLGLQEDYAVTRPDVLALVDRESDPTVQSWALTFALNPLPPAKLSNDTLRIEMEQSLPIGPLIGRANEAARPALRRLYLQMIARASVREGEQQRELLAFYRTLRSADERALILPAAATTLDSFPDLWTAMGGNEQLRNAAVAGAANLHRLRVKQLNSSETDVRSTTRSLSSVEGFAAEIADRLLGELAGVRPADARVPAALRVLEGLPLPEEWSVSALSVEKLLAILRDREEPSLRRRALRLLGKLKAESIVGQRPRVTAALVELCRDPDAHLYRDLLAVKTHLSLAIEVPKPPAATVPDVLERLEHSNAGRGQDLFFDRVGAGCVQCHRVRGRGSDVAPDLSGVGLRLTPENMVRAIVEPNAAVTKGYAMQLIQTKDGRTHTGAVIRETDSTLTLLRTDSTQLAIAVEEIESRKRLKQSVMPAGYELFGVEQVADLTAWLLTLRDGSAPAPER